MNQITREKHILDATGQIGGRLASQTAVLLIGKHKTTFQPNIDGGDFVEIKNINQMIFSGKKLADKPYYHASGFPGGLKSIIMGKLFKENPSKLFTLMVMRMLPKNKLRSEMIKRLIIS